MRFFWFISDIPNESQEERRARIFRKMREEVHNQLSCCGPGQELEVLNRCLKPDAQTLWLTCKEVERDLMLSLRSYYPFARVGVFGSTVMGIAFKGNAFCFGRNKIS